MKNIEEDNKVDNIEDKMRISLEEMKNLSEATKKDIEKNKKEINENKIHIKRTNSLNKQIADLYKTTNIMAEEDDQIVGGMSDKKFNKKMVELQKALGIKGGKIEKLKERVENIWNNYKRW